MWKHWEPNGSAFHVWGAALEIHRKAIGLNIIRKQFENFVGNRMALFLRNNGWAIQWSLVWKSIVCPPGIQSKSWKIYAIAIEHPLGVHWRTIGHPLEIKWRSNEHPLDFRWTSSHRKSIGHPYIVDPSEIIWNSEEKPLEIYYISAGSPLCFFLISIGNPLISSLGINVKPKGNHVGTNLNSIWQWCEHLLAIHGTSVGHPLADQWKSIGSSRRDPLETHMQTH